MSDMGDRQCIKISNINFNIQLYTIIFCHIQNVTVKSKIYMQIYKKYYTIANKLIRDTAVQRIARKLEEGTTGISDESNVVKQKL